MHRTINCKHFYELLCLVSHLCMFVGRIFQKEICAQLAFLILSPIVFGAAFTAEKHDEVNNNLVTQMKQPKLKLMRIGAVRSLYWRQRRASRGRWREGLFRRRKASCGTAADLGHHRRHRRCMPRSHRALDCIKDIIIVVIIIMNLHSRPILQV